MAKNYQDPMAIYEAEKARAMQYADMMNSMAEAQKAAYDASCASYAADQESFKQECRALFPEATDTEIFGMGLRAGYGPRIYNPPASCMVKYIVS